MRATKKVGICLVFIFFFVGIASVAWALKCPVCGANNKSSSKFCSECGESLCPKIQLDAIGLKGPKKTVGVLSFENKTSFKGRVALGDDFSNQLTESLMKSGQFTVVARQDLSAVITEQDLAATDRFAKSEVAKKGNLVPAQIIIKGAVTEFESKAKGGGTDIRFGDFGIGDFGISGKTENAHVAVIVYIIDTATGQILDSQRIEGSAKSGGLGFDYAYDSKFGLGTSGFNKTPLGKATQEAINEAVNYIAKRLADVPWEGRIAKVDGATVFINSGSSTNIKESDMFTVYGEGETLTDPVTGMSLGSEKTKVAKVIVTEVQENFSKAKIIESTGAVKRGDLLTLE
ncbi:MAG: zinc-ribbon domain-containing protein [Candidatus Omnitrophica bacterium]|nr:zinc-ribbon domain-containing protein [Candidatus Omnitrophota bacterium]